ncbi:unnamed protein product, partial [Ilex paraguariensis]
TTSALLGDPEPHTKSQGFAQSQVMELFNSENKTNGLSSVNVMEPKSDEILPAMEKTQTSNMIVGSESKHIKGALPEGFFDDKDSDLRARGITPIKPDVKLLVGVMIVHSSMANGGIAVMRVINCSTIELSPLKSEI